MNDEHSLRQQRSLQTGIDSNSVPSWEKAEGQSYPLGAVITEEGSAINFAIYSKHATEVALLLFAEGEYLSPTLRYEFNYLRNKSGPVWHCRLSIEEVGASRFYGYQISGPPPSDGFLCHKFDAEKLLLDPYAKIVHFPPKFECNAAIAPGSNLGRAPLGLLPHRQCAFEWTSTGKPRHSHDLIIYELHIRGFTANLNSGVEESKRGTFAGVVEKIPHLKSLGVTAVELMPVFQFDPLEDNYWGYMPLNFFAPHNGYAICPDKCEQIDEFRAMVDALHAADIEVILDVVYNHTCEQDGSGPTYSFKGIDNSTYYMTDPDAENPFVNFSGTGNTLHTANAATRQLIVDSLRYWVQEMKVDGFRFDLASIFTRYSDGRINTEDPPIFSQIGAEDDLAGIRLIAEPWDAVGTTQLGRKFPGHLWMQWNSDFRDTVQRFVRGDHGQIPDLMTRIYGSADHFPDDRLNAFRPRQSVNYVTSHDGMTLYDLTAYKEKNNWANGENNQDGAVEFRWNCGWKGDSDAPASVMTLRKQQVKNFITILMLSNGTPMFRMGDEFLQTQLGNNNPFNQDNKTSWLDWDRLDRHNDVFQYFQQMILFRKRHPSISRSRFWRDDLRWYGTGHDADLSDSSRAIAWCLHGGSQNDCDIYVMLNSHEEELTFGIYEGAAGDWLHAIDTSYESGKEIASQDAGDVVNATSLVVKPRSVVVLLRI